MTLASPSRIAYAKAMIFREVGAFDVVHGTMGWPWVAFSADGAHVAFASSPTSIGTRRIEDERVVSGPSFALPADLALDTTRREPEQDKGLRAFSISIQADVALAAVTGISNGAHVVAIVGVDGEKKRTAVEDVLGPGHEVRAIAFDRSGRRLWLSAENGTETVLALLDCASLTLVGDVKSGAFPPPAQHELYLHAVDDAVLLLAACGQDGTFARVAGYAGDVVSGVPTALDGGAVPAGFVGFSADGARVHLVEADELRTHAWPTLDELSSVQLADDFLSSYSGAVLGDEILVDGEDSETQDDAVMLFDRAAIHGAVLPLPAPAGMWAGRLGQNAIVTLPAKGDPVQARVLVRTAAATKAFGTKHLLS